MELSQTLLQGTKNPSIWPDAATEKGTNPSQWMPICELTVCLDTCSSENQ